MVLGELLELTDGWLVTRGVYRTFSVENGTRYAHVEYDSLAEMDIPEARYRARGYRPEFDALPWKDGSAPVKAMNASSDAQHA